MRGRASSTLRGSRDVAMTTLSFASSSGRTLVTRSAVSPRANVRSSGSRSRSSPVVDISPSGRSAVAAPRDAARDDLEDRRVALEPQAKAAPRRVADRGARQDARAGDRHRRPLERHLRAGRERLEDVAHPRAQDDLARRGPEDAVDAHVLVGGGELGEGLAPGPVGRERLAEPLFTPVVVDQGARHEEQAVLAPEAVDQPRGLRLGGGAGERLALLGGHGRGDDRGRDVHAGVGLALAVARPLARRDVQRDGRRDGVTRRADAERELALARPGERDRLLARELHALRPHAGQARLANRLEQLLHRSSMQ